MWSAFYIMSHSRLWPKVPFFVMYYTSNIFFKWYMLELQVPFLLSTTHLFFGRMHYYPPQVPLIFILMHVSTSLTVLILNYVELHKKRTRFYISKRNKIPTAYFHTMAISTLPTQLPLTQKYMTATLDLPQLFSLTHLLKCS